MSQVHNKKKHTLSQVHIYTMSQVWYIIVTDKYKKSRPLRNAWHGVSQVCKSVAGSLIWLTGKSFDDPQDDCKEHEKPQWSLKQKPVNCLKHMFHEVPSFFVYVWCGYKKGYLECVSIRNPFFQVVILLTLIL